MNDPAYPQQLQQDLLDMIGLHDNNALVRQKQRKIIILALSVASWLQFSIILLTIQMATHTQILKILGLGFLVVYFLLLGIFIPMIISQNQNQGYWSQEDYEANGTVRMIFLLQCFFMLMCIMNQVIGDYHYVLCGCNTFIIFTAVLATAFKYRTFRFLLRYMLILFSSFWISYYFLNVTWGRNVHWGFNIYFGLCGFVCFPMVGYAFRSSGFSYKSTFVLYFYSIFLYFIILSFILTWTQYPPYVELTSMIHICYVIFCGACIKKYPRKKKKTIENEQIMFQLIAQSNNVLKKKEQNYQNIQQTLPSGDPLHHECRICLTSTSNYALQCDGFYHFCICDQCIKDWVIKFKGKCMICNNISNFVVKINKQGNYLVAVGIFNLNNQI